MQLKLDDSILSSEKKIAAGVSTGLMADIEKSISKKVDLFDNSFGRYAMRAMLACCYLTLGTGIAVGLANFIDQLAPGWGESAIPLCSLGHWS